MAALPRCAERIRQDRILFYKAMDGKLTKTDVEYRLRHLEKRNVGNCVVDHSNVDDSRRVPTWPHSSGPLGLILIVMIVLLFTGKI